MSDEWDDTLRALVLAAVLATLVGCGSDDRSGPDDTAAPMLEVAETGDLPALERLLARHGDANARNTCDGTPLMLAARNGHDEVVARLLAAGASIDATDEAGYTALMLAAGNGHRSTVALLLANGAMIDAQEHDAGVTALAWAAAGGHDAVVEELLARGADPTLPDFEGRTADDHARTAGFEALAARLTRARGQHAGRGADT